MFHWPHTFDKSKWTRYSGLNYRQPSFRYCIDKTVDLHVSHILSEHKIGRRKKGRKKGSREKIIIRIKINGEISKIQLIFEYRRS